MPTFNDKDYELLSSYLDDALTPTEKAALETRLQADSDLLNELDTLRVVQQAVQSLPVLKAPRDFRLTTPMIGQTPKVVVLPRRNAWWVSAAAAVVVAVVGIGLFVASNRSSGIDAGEAQVAVVASATFNTAALTTATMDVARRATDDTSAEETATLSAEEVIADMVPLNIDTNMLPTMLPSSPIVSTWQMTPVTQTGTIFFGSDAATQTSADGTGGAAQEQLLATAANGAVDLANLQQEAPATNSPAPTMTTNIAGMAAPMGTPTMDIAMSAMVAPNPTSSAMMELAAPAATMGEAADTAAAVGQANATSQKTVPALWWTRVAMLVAILQAVALLLVR